jgi:hypothetical protein
MSVSTPTTKAEESLPIRHLISMMAVAATSGAILVHTRARFADFFDRDFAF